MENLQTSPWIVPTEQGIQVLEEIRPWAVAKRYPAGAILYRQGEKIPGLFFITAGTVKRVCLSPGGDERLINIVSSGCPVGEAAVVDGLPSQLTAVAMTDVEVLFVDRQKVFELVRGGGEMGVALLFSMGRQLRALVMQMADSTGRPVPDRLMCLLHHLTRQSGPDRRGSPVVTLKMSQQQLAEMLGVSRVTVSTSLATLKEQGILETGHGMLRILKPSALRTCGGSPHCISDWEEWMAN